MWINKNVYNYEKVLAKDRIAELEMEIECYKAQLKEDKKFNTMAELNSNKSGLLQRRRNLEIAGQRQADHLNPTLEQAFGMSHPSPLERALGG